MSSDPGQNGGSLPNGENLSIRFAENKDHILSYMDNGYYEINHKADVLYCNDAFLNLLGYTRSEVTGLNLLKLADEKTAQKIMDAFDSVSRTNEPITGLEYQLTDKNGKSLSGEMSVCPARNNTGEVIGFTGMVKDRTRIKVLEADLAMNIAGLEKMISSRALEMEEELEQKNYVKTINAALFAISKAINISKNLDELYPVIHQHLNTIVRLDHFYICILDQSKETLHVDYWLDPGDRPLANLRQLSLKNTMAGRVLNEQQPLLLNRAELSGYEWDEIRYGPVPEEWMGIPLTSQDRVIGIMIAYSEDDPDCFTKEDLHILVSASSQVGFAIERRRILDQLQLREEKYRRLIETATAGYWHIDEYEYTVEVNQALCDMLGYNKDQIIGKKVSDFIDTQAEQIYDVEFKKRLTKRDRHYDLIFRRKNNELLYAHMDATSVFDETGRLLGSFAVVTDITDKILVQKELAREKDRAEEANKAKSQFIANMSHEIRTPLNGIMGMAELLVETALEEEQKNLVQVMSAEADALLVIINDILDFSKIEAGKMELEEIGFDLRKMFEDFSDTMALQAGEKGLDFLSFLDPAVPAALKGDPGRLRQILINLVGNALKFTKKGEIFVSGKRMSETSEKVVVLFEVTDTGIGIPKDKQELIFKSFSQADGSTTRKYGGTGLGTTISKQLVEMMGGEIGLESHEGKGSRFWFTIEFQKEESAGLESDNLDTDLTGICVLVVENNEAHQNILSEYLTSLGCCCVEAKTGESGFAMLEKQGLDHPVDIILAAAGLPGVDGFDFAGQIRLSGRFKDLPVVLTATRGQAGDGRRCRDIGINGYLSKPIRKTELQMTLASVLGMIDQPMEQQNPLVTRHYINEQQKKPAKILVVEDYPTNQQIALRHLNSAGFDVALAENGAEAVALFKKTRFDLIFMDIQMPLMDGYEATKQIRSIEERMSGNLDKPLHTPIIATTAHAMKGYREKCIRAQMDDYLTKPLKRKQLIGKVAHWILPDTAEADGQTARIKPIKETDKKTSIGPPPVDMDQALEEFDNDQDFLNEIIEAFLQEAKTQIDKICRAVDDLDFYVIERQSHSIKGGAANLIASELSQAAGDLEMIGKNKDTGALKQAVARLKTAYRHLVEYTG